MEFTDIIKDKMGRIIYIERDDGYEESRTYNADGSYKIVIKYPNGIRETERYLYFSTNKSRS